MNRYDFNPEDHGSEMWPRSDGEWVRYEDHCEAMKRMAREPEGEAEPLGWYEAEPSCRGVPLQSLVTVIGQMAHSGRFHWQAERPETSNPVWPIYATPPAAMSAERDAPSASAQQAEPVHLDGRICEHCGEGNAVLTFEDGQFASNCDMCSADCDHFMVERLNQLIAAPTPSASPASAQQRDLWKRISQFLSDVTTAAGLVSHGSQSKALGKRLGSQCAELRSEFYVALASPSAQQDERGALSDETTQPWYDAAWAVGATSHTSFAGDELESLTFTPHEFETFCSSLLAQQVQTEGEAKPVFYADAGTVRNIANALNGHKSTNIGVRRGECVLDSDVPLYTHPSPATEGASTGALTDAKRIADILLAAWQKAEPGHTISQYPESYKATFLDMARALLAASPAKENSNG